MCLGDHELDRATIGTHGTAGDRARSAVERATEIARRERSVRRRAIQRGRAHRIATALEVIRERERIVLACSFEPLAGELMPELAIAIGQHRVCSLADES